MHLKTALTLLYMGDMDFKIKVYALLFRGVVGANSIADVSMCSVYFKIKKILCNLSLIGFSFAYNHSEYLYL